MGKTHPGVCGDNTVESAISPVTLKYPNSNPAKGSRCPDTNRDIPSGKDGISIAAAGGGLQLLKSERRG